MSAEQQLGEEERAPERPAERRALRALAARLAAAQAAEPEAALAGVDEAGLGPILGPLVVGWCALDAPAARIDAWRALGAVVSRRPGSDARRLVVADSKQVFDRTPRGAKRLELGVLCFLALLAADGRAPLDARALLREARARLGLAGEPLAHEPWAECLPLALPRASERELVEVRAARLARELARAGLALGCCGAHALGAEELNASFRATESKSRTHWDACAPVLRHLWRRSTARGLVLVVDRHGARVRYGALLEECLGDAAVEVVDEGLAWSEYLCTAADGRRMRACFSERADQLCFPVALASCQAKLARELCMEAFNAFFERLRPGLRPTAGYWSDGLRWLDEAGPLLAERGLAREALVRER